MERTVTVIFDGEVLRPQQPLDLRVNVEYQVTVWEDDPKDGEESRPHGASSASEEFPADQPLMRYARYATPLGVTDLAEQHDHYVYGTPKR